MKNDFLKRLFQAHKNAPQRHSQLPPDLEARARTAWKRAKPWWAPSYETFEFQLCKDVHPEKGIAMWEHIADTLDVYLASHPSADRGWAQDFLCMISLDIGRPKKMHSKRRRMYRELRRIYLKCGGKIDPLTVSAVPHVDGHSPFSPQDMSAIPIEQVSPTAVRQADCVLARDRQTRRCYIVHPETVPSSIDGWGDLDRTITTLLFEFDEDDVRHQELVSRIIQIANGESEEQ